MPQKISINLYKNGSYGFFILGTFPSMVEVAEYLNSSKTVIYRHIRGAKISQKLLMYKFERAKCKNNELQKLNAKKRKGIRDKMRLLKNPTNLTNSHKAITIQKLLAFSIEREVESIKNIELKLWEYNYLTLHKVLKEFESENSKIYNFKDFTLFDKYAK